MKLRTKAKTRIKRLIGNSVQFARVVWKGLPPAFTLPLIAAAGTYFLFLFPLLVYKIVPLYVLGPLIKSIATSFGGGEIPDDTTTGMCVLAFIYLLSATVTLVLAAAGLLVSYITAGQCYQLYRLLERFYVRNVLKRSRMTDPVLPLTKSPGEGDGEDNPLASYKRIGIILSGGGAKGAYQAGAMKAVYEFIEEHGMHRKVCMIAGTSIGSWNALFWLAGLVKERAGGHSPIKEWWSSVNVRNVILPVAYIPTRQNYFLSNKPWKDEFDDLFSGTGAGELLERHIGEANGRDPLHFYFTRSNIGKASLAYTTNRRSWDDVTPNQTLRRTRSVVGDHHSAVNLNSIREGVFSSMDIPPLFEYSTDNDKMNFFEDGGVVDNLPIRFGTEVENCDLLFILPLNASFDRKVNRRSVFKRLARVTEIRQGVLERNSFKMIYLYNELAGLRRELDSSRDKVKELERRIKEMSSPEPRREEQTDGAAKPNGKRISEKKIAARARTRSHKLVHVFSICPGPELKIYTTEFWKTEEAAEAFRFMYQATQNELKKFKKIVNSDVICTAIVGHYDPARKAFFEEIDSGRNVSYERTPMLNKETPELNYRVEYFTDF